MAKKGRPSLFTQGLADRICERLAAGETLRGVCADEDMPAPQTVLRWTNDQEGFSEQYAKAREIGYRGMADELTAIADDKTGDPARDRLRLDTRKWLLSKALPKIYGDKQQVEHTIGFGAALERIQDREKRAADAA